MKLVSGPMAVQSPHYLQRIYSFSRDAHDEVDLLFLGDSLVERYDLAFYFPGCHSVNRGIDGDTVYGVLQRIEPSLNIPEVKNLFLLIGVNDTEDASENYPRLLKAIKQRYPRTNIVAFSVLPTRGLYSKINVQALELNKIIRASAKSIGVTYVDVRYALEDEKGELEEAYTVDDIHLTPMGYERLTKAIMSYLKL